MEISRRNNRLFDDRLRASGGCCVCVCGGGGGGGGGGGITSVGSAVTDRR